MTNGALFDLCALGAAALIGGTTLALAGLRAKLRGRRRPFDYEVDAPEFCHAKETHLRLVDGEWFV